ncbi:membrane bound O-acyl transferase MBOAT family protein [Candidatus Thiomargarita nelsonii]|uniref:Membrane bound O-acyl transferase MBOAT family protein n=1 Tax=Candidatus Thiomargarita nelsonii TaxID=1003181 RepID=A0A176RV85_9GAMM|nr:membrane bound O-acyl transferase MBOAT family protein [Candidatus Thiomargarita nelsonii]
MILKWAFWIAAPYFEAKSSFTLIIMLFGYSMQIFADFAGYSLIAIGVAALFGYKLPKNFNYPYISSSITEFWRRWHISLSSWLKEYLYISLLGGNRKGNIRTYINLIIVMFLGGLWHGAALSYGVWGLWHGIGLAIERKFSKTRGVNKNFSLILTSLRIALVFSFVSFGWLLFKLTNIQEAVHYLIAIKENINIGHSYVVIINIAVYSLPVVLYHILYLGKKNNINIVNTILKHDYAIYATMIIMLLINGGIPGDFVYFQF